MRFVEDPKKDFFPPGSIKPTVRFFSPTERERNSTPVRISWWDDARTTRQEAWSILKALSEDRWKDGHRATFVIRAGEIRQIELEGEPSPLDIVYDPVDAAVRTMAGADGHAGLEGLGDRDDLGRRQNKNRRKALYHKLRHACLRHPDECLGGRAPAARSYPEAASR